jgi:hypothetical protein
MGKAGGCLRQWQFNGQAILAIRKILGQQRNGGEVERELWSQQHDMHRRPSGNRRVKALHQMG